MLNITPELFGAVGDWNDVSGTDDSAAFSAMATHIAANPGTVVTIRRKHYVKSGWQIGASNFSIRGIGSAQVHSDGAAGQDTLRVTGGSNIEVSGVKFSQPRSLLRGNEFCMYFLDCANVRALYNWTDGGTAGIWFNHCAHSIAQGNTVDTPKADGIHFSHGSRYCKAICNTVLNPGDDAFAASYYNPVSGRTHHIDFIQNSVSSGYWGFGFAIYSADYINIIGNSLTEIALGMVTLNENAGGGMSTNIHISDNRASGLCRVSAVPMNYWHGLPDEAVTSVLFMAGALLRGENVSFIGNSLFDIKAYSPSAQARTGVRMNGGTAIRVMHNGIRQCGWTGIAGGDQMLSECTVSSNALDEVNGVGVRFENTPLSTSLVISGNAGGYGAINGDPFLVRVVGAGATRVAICGNTSASGRGISTDSGTGSTNLLIAGNYC
ncbi:hypothetical protein ACQCLI_18060 [Pseudomonas nitroreducens]|uniref:hypothetical protein n=1 Tax=Pseudomonas nitroreducens TaxID=46680 RepID=UPI00031F04C7|nr:hypothetical protein [Pseudomonas nitroreducens]